MGFNQFKDHIIVALMTAGLGIFGWIAISVTELNKNVAVVVSTVAQHEKRIELLEGKE